MIIAIIYYNYVQATGFTFSLISIGFLALFAAAGAIVEGFTPKGLDNLTVPFVIAAMYWMIFIL